MLELKKWKVADVANKFNEELTRTSRNAAHFSAICDILKAFEGKVITKRLQTALTDAGYAAYYKHEFGMYQLDVWGKGIEYNDRLHFLLRYDSEGNVTFTMENFKKRNLAYVLEEERVKNLAIAKPKVLPLVSEYNALIDQITAFKIKAAAICNGMESMTSPNSLIDNLFPFKQ